MTVFAAGTAVLFGGIVPLSELAGFEANDADQVTVSATTAHGHLWQVKTAGMPMQRLCFLMALLWVFGGHCRTFLNDVFSTGFAHATAHDAAHVTTDASAHACAHHDDDHDRTRGWRNGSVLDK